MKTDEQLKWAVTAVKNGVISLSAHLDTYPEKLTVERAVARVAGVKAMAIKFSVRLDPDHKRGDSDIAAAAESAPGMSNGVNEIGVRL